VAVPNGTAVPELVIGGSLLVIAEIFEVCILGPESHACSCPWQV